MAMRPYEDIMELFSILGLVPGLYLWGLKGLD